VELYDEFRWGLIGPGRIARRFAESLESIPTAFLNSVASRDLQKAKDFADDYAAPEYFGAYGEMLLRSKPDAVYISTPHNFHFEQAMMCLEAGVPVLCEKPLTVNSRQAQQLFNLAKAKGVFLMEALWTRYLPVWREAKVLVKSGYIGDLHMLDSNFGFSFPRFSEDRVLNPHLAGGALLDIGIYPLAMSQWILDSDPLDVKVHAVLGETGVDELLSVTMMYSGNIVSRFSANILARTTNDFWIYGSEGRIRIHENFWEGTRLTLIRGSEERTQHFPFRKNGFEYEAEELMRCVKLGLMESPDMTEAHSLGNLRIMDRIRQEIGLKYPFED